jgi:hypothetical protein
MFLKLLLILLTIISKTYILIYSSKFSLSANVLF